MTCPVCQVEYNDPTLCDCPTEPECDDLWVWISDWEGDPTLYRGTHDLSRFECEECGKQRDRHDPRMREWIEKRQPEYERDDQ